MQVQRLEAIFNQQESQISSISEVKIQSLEINTFIFSIKKRSSHKKPKQLNSYKLKFDTSIIQFGEIIQRFVSKYPFKSLFINICTWDSSSKQIYRILNKIIFSDIVIFSKPKKKINLQTKQQQKEINQQGKIYRVLQFFQLGIEFQSIQIDIQLSMKNMFLIYQKISLEQKAKKFKNENDFLKTHEQQKENNEINDNNDKSYHLYLQKLVQQQIIQLIRLWCNIKCQQCQASQKLISTPNKKRQKDSYLVSQCLKLYKMQNQTLHIEQQSLNFIQTNILHIYFRQNEVLTLSSLKKHGYQVFIRKELSKQQIVLNVIPIILECKYFISFQVENLVQGISNILDLVFKKYKFHSNYLIKLSNQIELTSYRLSLNTSGLSDEQVYEILELMKLPGHYQLICYGQIKYFSKIKQLFLKKPFIKFNYFSPMKQNVKSNLKIIQKMESIADDLKIKVLQFASIIISQNPLNFRLVQQLFYSLQNWDDKQ